MTTVTDTTVVPAWEKATADYTAIVSATPGKDTTDDELDEWCADVDSAVQALLAIRAPSPSGIALKARAVLAATARYSDEKADNPRTIAMLLDSEPL